MSITESFASFGYPHFNAAGIRVSWNPHVQGYVAYFGPDTQVQLVPADAQHLAGQLIAALIVQGDAVDFAKIASDAVDELQSLAHELKWNGDPKTAAKAAAVLADLGYVAEAVRSQ